ncbi:MAG: hypothetical protein DLD55_06255 [candidate division SR1 bacterium]|nr:MAG: hypothetical protein DLD55_06255 [candidate division SR1 bacterium]
MRGKNQLPQRDSYKAKPLLNLTTAGKKQLANLLKSKPLSKEQDEAFENIKSRMNSFKKFKMLTFLKLAKEAIQGAKKTKHEKR